ncbi:gamma-glutamylcyclotransferase family protein [Actinoplanes sp. RD1]|uniref:gamma-glutamylcyclotransferase family protein n=1 Tax=Actinoplanes sp. RD1 TaxID=3064538 RepID=UPI002742466D|nr:gamma-glutamylcyclotransferase family protein [Actinoplanes sp. RD1]
MSRGVFAYGSLAAPATMATLLGRPPVAGRDFVRTSLPGWALSWNVCTDNTSPDRKVSYEDPVDGTRPAIQVLFLTVEPAPAARVEGVLIFLPAGALPALDAREGNYLRTSVGDAWTYVARPASAARARRAIREGTARIRRDYYDTVAAAYRFHEGMPAVPEAPAPIVTLRRVRH